MRIIMLGTGTGYPTLKRSACSVLIEIGDDRLLFDLGAGTMRRLLDAGSSISQVTHIFLSHLHPDHTGELASFLFATKYPEVHRRRTPLAIIGKGVNLLYDGLKAVYGRWIEPEGGILKIIDLNGRQGGRLDFPNFRAEFQAMPHIESSVGYRITTPEGRSVVYTGDTDYSEEVIDLARNADLLITEASMPDEKKVEGHLTPSLAGQIAAKAQVGRLVLTHMYPECEQVDIEAQCRKTWKGELTVAEDLMEFEV
jgi:ribonuclease BN (tRNA processing enzyme)